MSPVSVLGATPTECLGHVPQFHSPLAREAGWGILVDFM